MVQAVNTVLQIDSEIPNQCLARCMMPGRVSMTPTSKATAMSAGINTPADTLGASAHSAQNNNVLTASQAQSQSYSQGSASGSDPKMSPESTTFTASRTVTTPISPRSTIR